MPRAIVFLHGLESGPRGRKYQALVTAFGEVEAPDTEGVFDVEARFTMIARATEGRRDLLVVGSSFGGLMAALLADRHPARVGAMVLAAPALHWPGGAVTRAPADVAVLHGVHDAVVPIAASEAFVARHGGPLVRVDAGHDLNAHLDVLVDLVRARR